MIRFALLLFLSVVALAADLTGKWSGTFDEILPDGSAKSIGGAYMDLKVSGETVTGTAGPDEAHQNAISNGKLAGNKLTFEVAQGQGILRFDLTFDGESIKGRVAAERDGERKAGRVDLKRKQ